MKTKPPLQKKRSFRPFSIALLLVAATAAGFYLISMRRTNLPTKEAHSPIETVSDVATIKIASPVRGTETAPVTIEEFSDFQCPFCARSVATLKQILETHPAQVRWIFRHFPVFASHPNAPAIHLFSVAAGEQNRFWEMHDLLFENQDRLSPDDLLGHARRLNLDLDRFNASLRDRSLMNKIEADYNEGVQRGVRATPTFFVNGRKIEGAIPYPLFKREVELALAKTTDPVLPPAK